LTLLTVQAYRCAFGIGSRRRKPLPLQDEHGTIGGEVGRAVATLRFFLDRCEIRNVMHRVAHHA